MQTHDVDSAAKCTTSKRLLAELLGQGKGSVS